MLNGSAICNRFRYGSVKFRYHSPLWDSKSVRYVRKFVASESFINVQFFKYLLRGLPGFKNKM